MIYNWSIIFIVLLLIEISTTNLVTIWFALGALSASICSLFTSNTSIQIIVFLIVSVISLIFTRKITKRFLQKNIIKTNYDIIIGKTGIVTKSITDNEYGEVKIDGKYWTAISKENISTNSKVEILSIDGVKLVVKKKEDED